MSPLRRASLLRVALLGWLCVVLAFPTAGAPAAWARPTSAPSTYSYDAAANTHEPSVGAALRHALAHAQAESPAAGKASGAVSAAHAVFVAAETAGGGGDLTTLYRAVGKDELKDIQGTGVYRAAPGGTEGKYFFPTRGQAEHFSSLMEKAGQGSSCITSGCIPTSVLRGVETIHPAGEGTAYFIPSDLLPAFSNIIVHG